MSATVYRRLQALARATGRSTEEVLTLYALERTLDRLGGTPYRDDFSLKGGVLLAAFALRRPTRDIDMQALDFPLDAEHVRTVVDAIAAVPADDGLVIDPAAVTVVQIRDEDEYTGLRVTVSATVHTARLAVRLDVSTGDPIWPAPQTITLPGLLGDDVTLLGHPLVTVVAEKAVTVLQRGTTSTRWRDFLDLRNLARTHPFTASDIRAAAGEVAAHRQVELAPLASVTAGYGAVAQPKWSAWRRRNRHEDACLADFDDQLTEVLAFTDPVLAGDVARDARWDPANYAWGEA